MKLNVKERFMIMSILPQENNFVTLKIIRDLKSKLGPTDKEFKEFEIKTDKKTGSTEWNEKGKEGIEFEVGEIETGLIVTALKALNKENKLREDHFTLYEKFVEAD